MNSARGTDDGPRPDFQELLQAARVKDPEALDELFREYYARVETLVHRGLSSDLRRFRPWLRMRLSTGDVVQEVFRSALQDLDRFEGGDEDAFAGFLATLVRNRLIDLVRFHEAARRDGRRTAPAPDGDFRPSRARGPATIAMSTDEADRCLREIEQFPEVERGILLARLVDGLDFPTIVRELGFTSVSAARRTFFAAQSRLVIRLRQREREGGGE